MEGNLGLTYTVMTEADERHGRFAGYRAGCRCEACRDAQRSNFLALKVAVAAGDPDVVHGRRTTYGAGCKCDPCSSAQRDAHYQRSYGITDADYNALLEAQGGVCACCGGPPNGAGNRLYVDHVHGTKTIRGLLCFSCNSGIGALGDTIEGVERALSYLKAGTFR